VRENKTRIHLYGDNLKITCYLNWSVTMVYHLKNDLYIRSETNENTVLIILWYLSAIEVMYPRFGGRMPK